MDDDFDFTHIAPVKTAKLSLYSSVRWPAGSTETIKLEVRHAGDGNPGYLSARMATPVGKDRTGQYERLAKLYGRHVLTGWEGVGGKEFSAPAAERFLLALVRAQRHDIIDYITAFCVDADNFYGPVESAAALGKE